MERIIYKPEIAQDKDQDVPEFGGYAPYELRQPESREPQSDQVGSNALESLRSNALGRVLYFGFGIGSRPPVHFPNAEHFQHIPFAHRYWEQYGDMESEYSRLLFMLDKYPSRRFPAGFEPILRDVRDNDNPLRGWSNQIPRIDKASIAIYEGVLVRMEHGKIHDDLGYTNGEQGAYQSEPVFYESSKKMKVLELDLWQFGLKQIIEELSDENKRNVPAFLHLYNRIKDPIAPMRSGLHEQSRIFLDLLKEAQCFIPGQGVNARLVSQLALESSFLALPRLDNLGCVVYGEHHELPYIDIDVNKLPRGEFANPNRVIEVMEEVIAESERFGQAVITPITVSQYQEPYQPNPNLFIVDGNNRSTAVLLMEYLDYVGFDEEEVVNNGQNLRAFIMLHDLDIEWERDLAVAIKTLAKHPDKLRALGQKQALIREFAHSQIPALLVQEPNFHTVAVAQSSGDRIVLLQPMHQAIYNQSRFSMAIPSKQQSHGRAAGNDIRVSVRKKP